jgi:AcrR family transcriptional regulator
MRVRAAAKAEDDPPPPASNGRKAEPRSSIPPSLGASMIENAIVAAAMKVFARRGFVGARVEDVLDEARIARRTFYRYFTSKEDVLAAAYELATRELLRAFEVVAGPAEDALAAARAGIDLYLDFHIQNASLLRVPVEQSMRSDSALAEDRRRLRARLVQMFSRASDGAERVDDFTLVALVSALEGLAVALLDAPSSARDAARAKAAMRRLLDLAIR